MQQANFVYSVFAMLMLTSVPDTHLESPLFSATGYWGGPLTMACIGSAYQCWVKGHNLAYYYVKHV